MSVKWDREADIVVVGSGATGMPAAIVAREAGAEGFDALLADSAGLATFYVRAAPSRALSHPHECPAASRPLRFRILMELIVSRSSLCSYRWHFR